MWGFLLWGLLARAGDPLVIVVGCADRTALQVLKRRDPRRVVASVGDRVRVFLQGKWRPGKVADFPLDERYIDVEITGESKLAGQYGRIDLWTHRHHLDLRKGGAPLGDPTSYDALLGQRIVYRDFSRDDGNQDVAANIVAIDLEMGRLILRRELKPEESSALGQPLSPERGYTIDSQIAPLHSIPIDYPYRRISGAIEN